MMSNLLGKTVRYSAGNSSRSYTVVAVFIDEGEVMLLISDIQTGAMKYQPAIRLRVIE
jgi:hypothetical protein